MGEIGKIGERGFLRGGKVRCNYFARSKDGIDVVHGECYQEVLLGDSSLLLGLSRVLIVTSRIRLKYDGRSLCFLCVVVTVYVFARRLFLFC